MARRRAGKPWISDNPVLFLIDPKGSLPCSYYRQYEQHSAFVNQLICTGSKRIVPLGSQVFTLYKNNLVVFLTMTEFVSQTLMKIEAIFVNCSMNHTMPVKLDPQKMERYYDQAMVNHIVYMFTMSPILILMGDILGLTFPSVRPSHFVYCTVISETLHPEISLGLFFGSFCTYLIW